MSKITNILVVDDNQINRQYFSMAIQKFGHNVTLASNGFEAIELAKSQRFDLILMDIRMPEMGGDEATNTIRSISINRDTPVLAISAEEIPLEIRKIFNGFIMKPASPSQLKNNIDKYCIVQNKNTPVFDKNQALKFAYQDSDILKKLIKMFVDELPILLNQLEKALIESNITLSKDIVHKLRGSCKTCGARALDDDLNHMSQDLNSDLDATKVMSQIRQSASNFINNNELTQI